MEYSDLIQNLFGFVSGLIGAGIGGWFTLHATNQVIKGEFELELMRERREVEGVLDAIGVEISTLWDFHQMRIGEIVENLEPGQALEFYYPLTQDYFTIYDQNADLIGKIKDPELRKLIVVVYNKCKKVVDSFIYNNEIYLDYREYLEQPDMDEKMKKMLAFKHQKLIDFAIEIKKDHVEIKDYIEKLLAMLDTRDAAQSSGLLEAA